MSAKIDKYTKQELEDFVNESNSFQDFLRKIGYSSNSGNTYQIVRDKLKLFNINYSKLLKSKKQAGIKRTEENVFIKNTTADRSVVRKWYKKGNYTEYKCSICGQEPIWQGKELTLILDHINGNHTDSRLENLRWVCPNCNQQLPTTGFKRMRSKRPLKYCIDCGKEISSESTRCQKCFMIKLNETAKKSEKQYRSKRPRKQLPLTREELKEQIRTKPFTQIGKEQGVSDNAIRKWCKKYNLPSKSKEIKNYSDEEWNNI